MECTPLGTTGLDTPPIVFGTSSLGNLYMALPEDVQRSIIAEWFRQIEGQVVIDTAGKYGAGLALENLGRHLSALAIDPQRVIISNKLGWRRVALTTPEPTFEPGVWVDLQHDAVQDISFDGILRCHQEGCALLGDYAAKLVSVHDPDEYLDAASSEGDRAERWEHILAAYQALEALKENGEVAGIGVGSKDWTVIRDLHQRQPLDWVMIANSLTLHSHPRDLLRFIEQLRAERVGVVNSAVFNAGFLVGGEFYNYRKVAPETEAGKQLFSWREEFRRLCDEFSVLPAQACVTFGLSPPGVTAVALSSTRPARVADNIAAVDATMPKEFWSAMKEQQLINEDYPYLP